MPSPTQPILPSLTSTVQLWYTCACPAPALFICWRQVLDAVEEREQLLGLSPATLHLLKAHKVRWQPGHGQG